MRNILGAAFTLLALASPAWAADVQNKCDVVMDVTDKDPNGLNVRATPSTSGKILTALKLGKHGDYIEVHVTAQAGDWYAIDNAIVYNDIDDENDTTTPDQQTIFHGHGFVHSSKVGASELDSQALVHEAPSDKSKVIFNSAGLDETPVQILGCQGSWYKVIVKKKPGWSQGICTNERTTCV